MNKSYIKSSIIAVVLALLVPCLAYAAPPHDTTNDCFSKCHQAHKTLGKSGYNNICLNCHRYGSSDPRYAQIYPYAKADQSIQTGPSRGVIVPGSLQSSHSWEGSDDKPKVGAVPPTNPNLLGPKPDDPASANMFVGKLYCARCHAVHGATGYSDSVTPPFLRVPNNEDQMCLDCHRPRNVTSQQYGSHPVSINYSSIAKRKPTQYFNPPVNSNPQNPTAAMKIINGKVLCSTCHGVHHTDSNSRTFDNFSSVMFNRLSSSQGYLIRSDMRGANSSDRNICTNCHKTTDDDPNAKVKSHNGYLKKQNMQCTDCHGGHIDEVEADDPATVSINESIPNVMLIKRYMNYSSGNSNGRNPKVVYQYTSLTRRNYNNDQFGVCLACHKTLPLTIEQHKPPFTSAASCNECHTHKAGFSANCTDCHGMPPRVNQEGGPTGYAKGYPNRFTIDEAQSPHQSHASGTASNKYYAFSCNECHKAVQNSTQHGDGTFQDLFNSINGTKTVLSLTAVPPVVPDYNRTTRTCSNVYCHSNGLPAGTAPDVFKTVTWSNNINSIIELPPAQRCNQCHEATPTTNAHTKHLTSGQLTGCVNCHSNTVSDNTTLLPEAVLTGGTHVNGFKDTQFSGTLGSQTLSGTSCATVYCHSNGKGAAPVIPPVWSNPVTGACGACHFANNTQYSEVDAHFAHLFANISSSGMYGPRLNLKGLPVSCNECHTYPTNHVNGVFNAPGTAKCSPCHNTGAPSGIPVWTESGTTHRLACSSCHTAGALSVVDGVQAAAKSGPDFTLTGHGKPSIGKVCTDCHNPDSKHFNNTGADINRFKPELRGTPNTECNYCHTNASIVANAQFRNMSTHFTTKGGPQNMACGKCHDIHGSSNKSAVKTTFSFLNSTTWTITYTSNTAGTDFVKPDGRGLCQVCHTKTSFYRAGVTGQDHNIGTNCLSCHPHTEGFAAGGGCDGCHGYPPIPKTSVRMSKTNPLYASTYKTTYGFSGNYSSARFEDYSGGGGAHLNHVPDFVRASDGWAPCAACHTGGAISSISTHEMSPSGRQMIPNVTIAMEPTAKFSNAHQMIYSGAKLVAPPQTNKTGTCTNLACHYQPSPRWSKDR